ncbi:MAG: BT_3928 family protein [Lutibacter sp.]
MKWLVQISRILIGITFIFSGFVKMVDPLGTSYKLQEYLGPDVLNLPFLVHYALPLAVFLIFIEFFLGVTILLGFLPKLTVWSLFGLILLFLFLTWYSAYYNKVTDCGCFGDAVKLTPWQTFYKNIFFLALILILISYQYLIKPVFSKQTVQWMALITLIGSFYLQYYVLMHLPIIDFRPYAIGKNIPEQMKFKGEDLPPVHDFLLESVNGDDLTDSILKAPKVMLVVMNVIEKSRKEGFDEVKKISDLALKNNYQVYALSSSLEEEYNMVKKEKNLNFDVLFCDETTLKTIIRANPGIVILQNGTVIGKWNSRDIDKIEM